jgi:hypothetical protein
MGSGLVAIAALGEHDEPVRCGQQAVGEHGKRKRRYPSLSTAECGIQQFKLGIAPFEESLLVHRLAKGN